MIVPLQIIGGVLYTVAKLGFSLSERAKRVGNSKKDRNCRILAWVLTICGLPPFLWLFVLQRNWIALGVEVSGVPSMIIGILIAWRGLEWKKPKWLAWLAYACMVGGFWYSLYDFKGVTDVRQVVETSMVVAYLVGTWLVAHQNRKGYLWYVLMHVSMALLCRLQGWWWLVAQQLLSIVFVIDAYLAADTREDRDAVEV